MSKMILSDKPDAAVYIDGNIVGGVTNLKLYEKTSEKKLYEMLSDTPWYVFGNKKSYILELSLYGDGFEFEDDFGVVVVCGLDRFEFGCCNTETVEYTIFPDSKPVTKVRIICTERS